MKDNTICRCNPSGVHEFKNIDHHFRDDSFFYLRCMHCNEIIPIDADTEDDFYELFYDREDDKCFNDEDTQTDYD